jgi:hypothetical protein
MKVPHEAGLVDRDKRGVWVYYRVRPQALASLGALLAARRSSPRPLLGFRAGRAEVPEAQLVAATCGPRW